VKRLLIFLFFISFYGNSQYYEQKSGRKICEAIGRSFSSETIADEALEKILSTFGAAKRFVIQSCDNVPNAQARTVKGIRYIYYNTKFMSDINSVTDDYWSNMTILAHEVGHHINGHTLISKSLSESRKMELEADEFSGFVSAKLGATLTQAVEAIATISTNKDDTYSTHPSRSKRIKAITKGYNNGAGKKTDKITTNKKETKLNTVEEYFYSAYAKYDLEDYSGAIADYTEAIKIALITMKRGFSRKVRWDNYALAYNNRGDAKYNLGDNNGACEDFKKAAEVFCETFVDNTIALDNLRKVCNIDNKCSLGNLNTTQTERTITGTVRDKDGPIPGTNVMLMGTYLHTTTDIDGKYSLVVLLDSREDSWLIFSFGSKKNRMKSQQIYIGSRSTIDVVLRKR
jgi:tetratricopeptide (TPR) repeat protein